MKYAVKISELNLNKFVESLSNLIRKSVQEGLEPENTLLVVDLTKIEFNVDSLKTNRAITQQEL